MPNHLGRQSVTRLAKLLFQFAELDLEFNGVYDDAGGWGSAPASVSSDPHCDSQRSRAVSLVMRLSRSLPLTMSRVSTFDELPGAAAATTIACARSG
ncbi:hypothetical protein A5773_24985 [Mycobacterium sp. 852014-52450_SCH5900713]|nr:hypothetical protein A5773_24985 [Mycobacterium sp. 852014-52450_SCH5900713]